MLATHTPSMLLQQQLRVLLGHMPGVRSGLEDDIHSSRVATRRMHEALELVRSRHGETNTTRLIERLRKARRALGTARDADVAFGLLRHLDARLPVARGLVAELRARVQDERLRARRRLIKRLERLTLDDLPEYFSRLRPHAAARFMPADGYWSWRPRLREHVAERALAARQAIEHATGVYFPNRAHAARVALKKLRYAIELAEATGTWRAPRGQRKLRQVQEALGEAHDREMLMDRIRRLAESSSDWPRADADALLRFLTDETRCLHEDYLARRDDVLALAKAAEQATEPSLRLLGTRALLAATAVAVPSVLWLGRGRAAAEDGRRIRVSVRAVMEPT